MKVVRRQFGGGPPVSLFTLGTMRALKSPKQMYEILESAISAGINHLETAPAYGPAERFLGEALHQLKSEGKEPIGGWVITSKVLPGQTLPEGQEQIKGILKRIRVSQINNLAIHGINLNKHLDWALKGDGADLINWAEDQGLIGQIGFSSHGSYSLIEEALNSERFKFCSLHVHLLNQDNLPLALTALSNGLGVMAISPADKGGHLYAPSTALINDCKPIPPLELAYRFLLAQGISTLTLGACKSDDLELAQKLSRSDEPLNKEENQAIENLLTQGKLRLGESMCGQCKECLPCPQKVPIPALLHLRNLRIGHDLESFTKERYNLIGKAGHWWESINANACNSCGECMPRCPKELPIPDLLKETHEQLIASPQRRLWG